MAKKIVRVVGHKNPDTDSICAAIAYANLKSHTDDTMEYIPMRAGSISAETEAEDLFHLVLLDESCLQRMLAHR